MYICVCMRLYMHVFVNIYIVFAYIMNSVSLKTTLAVSLGCLHDDVRAEPGSWLVVGMIPVFDKRKAQRAGRPLHGPHGTARRRIALMHQCLSARRDGMYWVRVARFCSGLIEPGVEPASWLQPSSWTSQKQTHTAVTLLSRASSAIAPSTGYMSLLNTPRNTPMQSRQRLRELQTDITFLLNGCFAVEELLGPLLTTANLLCMRSVGKQRVEFTLCPMRCGTSLAVMCSTV